MEELIFKKVNKRIGIEKYRKEQFANSFNIYSSVNNVNNVLLKKHTIHYIIGKKQSII